MKEKLEQGIEKFGHTIMAVFSDGISPGFAYTIGLAETDNHPELIVFGLPPRHAHAILNLIVVKMREAKKPFVDGDLLSGVANLPVAFKDIQLSVGSEYMFQAVNRARVMGSPLKFQQVVLPDVKGYFPWNERYSENMRNIQPELWKADFDNVFAARTPKFIQ